MYYDDDVNTDALEGKTIAVIGYGSQGRAQSRNMADSGANVIVGVRENGSSWNLVKEDGMTVKTIEDKAFSSCSILTNINIPESVFYIGNEAFLGCAITSIIMAIIAILSILI